MSGQYDDIINLPYHVSAKRPQMPLIERAAQFAPFAALAGYDAAIKETGRFTNEKIELSEESLQKLDMKMRLLINSLHEEPEVMFTYFKPDEKKTGGTYIKISGVIKKVKEFERLIIMRDGTAIPMDDILDMEGDIFSA